MFTANTAKIKLLNTVNNTDDIVTIEEWRRLYSKDVASIRVDPRHEILRNKKVSSLRHWFNTSCKSILGIPAPRESLNRWLFEQRQFSKADPLLIVVDDDNTKYHSLALETELVKSIPARAKSYIVSFSHAFRLLQSYHKHALNMLDYHKKWFTGPKSDKDSITTFHTMRATLRSVRLSNKQYRDKEEIMSVLNMLVEKVSAPMQRLLLPKVKELVKKLFLESSRLYTEYKKDIALLDPNEQVSIKHVITENNTTVEISFTDHSSQTLSVLLRKQHYDKLRLLWSHHHSMLSTTSQHHTTHHELDEMFNSDVFVLMKRYSALFGDVNTREGTGFQGAIPLSSFKILTENFDVGLECFASPLNCYYANFCSAFIDTDFVFGSIGNFFDHKFVSGALEANPPFTIEVMQDMADHIHKMVSMGQISEVDAQHTHLMFVVVIPAWTDSPPNETLAKSPYLIHHHVLKAKEHKYISGEQFWVDTSLVRDRQSTMLYDAMHDTELFILSSDTAMSLPDKDIKELHDSFNDTDTIIST